MNSHKIQLEDEVSIILLPSNEADYPENVNAKILQEIPSDLSDVFIAELLQQPQQDFGYHVGEFLLIRVMYEEDKRFVYCEKSLKEASSE
ncbi:MAG TPA: hypothetical protein ENK66_08705 [Arcobacter sp.]|jgi:hypothetical protein|nr:hypothetical protein [Arcobacter sp.]